MTIASETKIIGSGQSRLDGGQKVQGQARYAAEWPLQNLLYGALVQSTIPRGRILEFDLNEAQAAPGVARIFTHANLPQPRQFASPPLGQVRFPLADARVYYEGQHIALVLAESLDQAQYAGSLVRVRYEPEPAEVDYRTRLESGVGIDWFGSADTQTGDVDAALKTAEMRIDVTYETADRHHAAMEPSATIADWRDGTMTLYDAAQGVALVRLAVSNMLGIPLEKVRIISKFLGGGFGSKGFVWPHQILAAIASRELQRPVKIVLTRAQSFTSHGYQCATYQSITLGAKRDGTLVAMRHRSWNPTAVDEQYIELTTGLTRSLYACPAIETSNRMVAVDRSIPTPMRAPHDGPGAVSTECAMDELAYALGIDPLELRLRNYAAETDPTTGLPFSQKNLRECYRIGAERFGWAKRSPVPGTMRSGNTLVGYGMATAMMDTFRFPSSARVTVHPDGSVLIESATQDIGGGQYTILPQIAAGVLGVPIDRVRIELGDTLLPEAGMTAGSSSTMGAGSAVYAAATKLREMLKNGGPRSEPVSAEATWGPEGDGIQSEEYSMHTYGAVFAEVHVDADLPIPRVARLVGVHDAGRIINTKTARSQMIGGMTWGIGQALLEASEYDRELGRFLSKNLAGYLVPVNADVNELDVTFIDQPDEHASPIGAKGIGELGAVGVAPAIANAIFHATGKRIRQFPIRPEHLL
jgi:xanthine dehydrogenase YagR molybdenum-binding subunit